MKKEFKKFFTIFIHFALPISTLMIILEIFSFIF
jgi:hypothetical protein